MDGNELNPHVVLGNPLALLGWRFVSGCINRPLLWGLVVCFEVYYEEVLAEKRCKKCPLSTLHRSKETGS